ncbi:PREDICTED: uncharacterized protein LOC106107108 [Papilio polytes]|uniref:uncharacterized protein LOC106107108 n=1 Tax=Papilio polytes TaxID=76194 RepID=UPI000675D8B7|nr:PREDICTED: uncharacterized protein LOC106107108 [Papilio polytes]
MMATVKFFQWFLTSTIVLLILLQYANSTRNNSDEVQYKRNFKDNPIKDLLFYGDQTDKAGKTHIIIKRQSDKYRYTPRPLPLPILVGGGGIGGFGRVVGRGFGARGPPGRGFGSRSVGARGFGARGLGGRGIGGLGGRGRG